jgi:hypothetical protein
MGGGTLSYQYAVVDSPEPDQRRALGEPRGAGGHPAGPDQAGALARPDRRQLLAGATSPNVIIDVLVDRC